MDFSKYVKYFNYGYFLSKYEPKFLKNLLKATEGESDINEPLTAGKAEHSREQLRKRLKDISKDTEIDKDLDRGFDPEI